MMIHDKELGEIFFRYNTRSKRINVRIEKERLLITLPIHCSEKEGFDFVKSIRSKIISKRKNIKAKSYIIIPDSEFKTLTFKVKVIPDKRNNFFSKMEQGVLTVYYPEKTDIKSAVAQRYFWKSITYFLRKEAKRLLPLRTYELAKKHNFSFSTVKIQSSTTRWGSCSSKKSINLSFYLLLLPEHLIDYVILHELCHTREMNHSDKFWKQMDLVTNNQSNVLKNEMKNYNIPKW